MGADYHHIPYYGAGDNSNSQPTANRVLTVGAAFVAVLTILLILSLICVYVRLRRRQYRQRFSPGRTNFSHRRGFLFAREDPMNLCNVGLDARVLESLPLFAYKAQDYKDELLCAVCLSEFEENEKARLLPNCKNSFHVDCIDMWFHSHSTCPICSLAAQPKPSVGNNNTDHISINVDSKKGKRAFKEQKPLCTKGRPRAESPRCLKPPLICLGGLKVSQAKNRRASTVDRNRQKLGSSN